MANRNIVVIGASAGGIAPLKLLISSLPGDLPAAVFVAVHLSSDSPRVLRSILNKHGMLPAKYASDGETIRPGCVYIAPADKHLVIERGHLSVNKGPRENGHRPSIDTLFFSAAKVYGPRVIGIILSGYLDDGIWGLFNVKRYGGITIAQDLSEAIHSDMPRYAIERVGVDYIERAEKIGELLARLTEKTVQEDQIVDDRENGKIKSLQERTPEGLLSVYTCPECGGALWETEQGKLIHFTCHVGHAFSQEHLDEKKAEAVDYALWIALRTLEETASLNDRLARNARDQGNELAAARYEESANNAKRRLTEVQEILMKDTLNLRKSEP